MDGLNPQPLTTRNWVGVKCAHCNRLNPIFRAGKDEIEMADEITEDYAFQLALASHEKPLCTGCGEKLGHGNVIPCWPPDSPLNLVGLPEDD
jgi:hypothetical protein